MAYLGSCGYISILAGSRDALHELDRKSTSIAN